jgi:hypothetical protein
MQRSDRGANPVLSRRSFVGKLAAGAAAVSTMAVGRAQAMLPKRAAASGGAHGSLGAAEPEMPVGSAVAVAPPAAAPVPVEAPREPVEVTEAPPWGLVRPLAMGSVVSHGWRLVGLRGVADGSCVLSLMNERGRTHRVHLCRNNGDPKGLVYTKHFDLVVMNGGQGDLPTEEGLAQAVAELAHVLAANEGDLRHRSLVTALLSQGERVRRFTTAAQLR